MARVHVSRLARAVTLTPLAISRALVPINYKTYKNQAKMSMQIKFSNRPLCFPYSFVAWSYFGVDPERPATCSNWLRTRLLSRVSDPAPSDWPIEYTTVYVNRNFGRLIRIALPRAVVRDYPTHISTIRQSAQLWNSIYMIHPQLPFQR